MDRPTRSNEKDRPSRPVFCTLTTIQINNYDLAELTSPVILPSPLHRPEACVVPYQSGSRPVHTFHGARPELSDHERRRSERNNAPQDNARTASCTYRPRMDRSSLGGIPSPNLSTGGCIPDDKRRSFAER